ncbi:MAG: VacJ family lipoprotein, partial [Wenzhouxiangellaceae bacterium]|nr:VacJ family lipoprotein [Wenzhouxiangellaceae bacterium]
MNVRSLITTAAAAFVLAACATSAPPPDQRDPSDPWEPYNRNIYKFNRTLDKAIVKPIAEGYEYVVPDPVETGITNFFTNLKSLQTMINLTLQGRPADTGRMLERFFVNTVFGLAGFFDVASKGGLPSFDEDFGQTMAVWGWKNSRYFVIPFLGPSTVRDGLGQPVDIYAD